jgi:hypothetical protein
VRVTKFLLRAINNKQISNKEFDSLKSSFAGTFPNFNAHAPLISTRFMGVSLSSIPVLEKMPDLVEATAEKKETAFVQAGLQTGTFRDKSFILSKGEDPAMAYHYEPLYFTPSVLPAADALHIFPVKKISFSLIPPEAQRIMIEEAARNFHKSLPFINPSDFNDSLSYKGRSLSGMLPYYRSISPGLSAHEALARMYRETGLHEKAGPDFIIPFETMLDHIRNHNACKFWSYQSPETIKAFIERMAEERGKTTDKFLTSDFYAKLRFLRRIRIKSSCNDNGKVRPYASRFPSR